MNAERLGVRQPSGALGSGVMVDGERIPRGGAVGPFGADRQPRADGFESRWDSRMGRGLIRPATKSKLLALPRF